MKRAFRPVQAVLSHRAEPGGAVFSTGHEQVSMRFLDDEIVRVCMSHSADHGPVESGAVIYEGSPDTDVQVSEQSGEVALLTPKMQVRVGLSPLRVGVYRSDGRAICTEEAVGGGMGWQGTGAGCRKVLAPDAHFYGFGEKTGYLDKRGSTLTMWNSDVNPYYPCTDMLYMSIPFFIILRGTEAFGIFLDSPGKTRFDMGKSDRESYAYFTDEGRLNYYVLAGPTLKDVLNQYTRLTGRMQMPPVWALGYHQSRYSYYPASQVSKVARQLRESGIPCDALYLDIDHMSRYRVFTFDEKGFADPRSLSDELAAMGFKLVSIVDPGVKIDPGYGPYERGLERGLFVNGPDGEPATVKVWPGDVHLPDFMREEARNWWADEHRILFDAGIAGIWNDMNEPAAFDTPGKTLPPESLHGEEGQEIRHERVHNLYANRMAEATALAYARLKPGERPFIISRAGYAGIQRYACTWTGDNSSWWDHLLLAMPMCLNLGLSGQPFVGADVGGFLFDADPELVTRWIQMGVFMPLFRNHSGLGTSAQEPYALGEPYTDVCRRYICLRYRLLPYLYSLMHESSETGLPVMRPMVMEFTGDEQTHRLFDQFMFGPDLLVAPAYQPGTECRAVYLPAGRWADVWTGEVFEGGRHILAAAPLDRVPVFARSGAIVPLGRVMNHTGEKPQTLEWVDVYSLEPGTRCLDLYVDDGKTTAYQKGEHGRMRFELAASPDTLDLNISWHWPGKVCALPVGAIRVTGPGRVPTGVSLDGVALKRLNASDELADGQGWFFDAESGRLNVGVNRLAATHHIRVAW